MDPPRNVEARWHWREDATIPGEPWLLRQWLVAVFVVRH
jgi:hypothetical protein